jgi:hypothetical protein
MSVFQSASFLGAGLVAFWLYVRFPKRRPATLTRALLRVAAAFGLFSLLPFVGHVLLPVFGGLAFILCVALPGLCFVFLSWIWLLACLVDSVGTPRGGHRVRLPKRAAHVKA